MLYKRLVYLYVFCMLLFSVTMGLNGCVLNDVTQFDSVDFVVCQEPLVEIDRECCLDRDFNDVCDFKEDGKIDARDKRNINIPESPKIIIQSDEEEMICLDQCEKDFCKKTILYECFEGIEGCNIRKKIGKLVGECGVECLEDTDCNQGYFCNSTLCESIELEFCGDGVCTLDEDCTSCVKDCSCQDGTFCELGICKEKTDVPFYDFYCILANDQFCIGKVDFNELDFAEYDLVINNLGEYGLICNYNEYISNNKTNSWRKEIRAGSESSSKIRFEFEDEIKMTYTIECFVEGQEQFAVKRDLSFNLTH